MQLHLDELPHQQKAIDAIVEALKDCRNCENNQDWYSNPTIKVAKNIDVKMETGTGKTYVYTRTMFELFRRFGINKFILFVPSLPIKEGTKDFITAPYVQQYFSQHYEGIRIDLDDINAGDFRNKKIKVIPSNLIDFLNGTRQEKKRIKCLLLNDAMLNSSSMNSNEYEQALLYVSSTPLEALSAVRPVVLIDEPHRFPKDGVAWKNIQKLNPQLIIRFGATFPEVKLGKGKQKISKPDYENKVYDLNAVQAFNQGLVKFVNISYPTSDEKNNEKYKVKSVSNKQLILTHENKEYLLNIGDNLPGSQGNGITFEGSKMLSNELELEPNMVLIPGIFARSYQEELLDKALEYHFIKERENWVRENAGENPAKIKTLALFFIDDIDAYRKGWFVETFDNLLAKKLKELIAKETNVEYKDFLQESLNHISETRGAYFAEDRGKKDEDIQREVEDILKNKQRLLSFKDNDGKWILRRFLFSKWTLREGWDNPNVFTIAKMRSSGREINKIQEIGRGLRLPVDENGKRLAGQEFTLNVLVDWSEKDFAKRLYEDIYKDTIFEENLKITKETLNTLVSCGYAATSALVKAKLLLANILDENDKVLDLVELEKLLPKGYVLPKNAIRENQKSEKKIKLRKENWDKIKDLWQQVIKRYMIKFNDISQEELVSILNNSVVDAFTENTGKIVRQVIKKRNPNEDDSELIVETYHEDTDVPINVFSYGVFLKKLAKQTNVQVHLWHKCFCQNFPNGLSSSKFNQASLDNIINRFRKQFKELFSQRYEYDPLNFSATTTLMKGNGEFVDSITQSLLGTEAGTEMKVEDNYLYDCKNYDSSLEKAILQEEPLKEVVVFGKLPKKSIKVPTYIGGTTSPDFIYAIEKNNKVKVNLFVEAKSENKRESDEIAVAAQGKLLPQIPDTAWKEITTQNINNVIRALLEKTE